MNAIKRDRAWGRYFARHGAARILAEAERAPHNDQRRARWYLDFFSRGLHRSPERVYRTRWPLCRPAQLLPQTPSREAARAGSIQRGVK